VIRWRSDGHGRPRRFTFTNPQSALYDRIAAVKAVAGDVPVEGRIVFTRRGRFPKGLPKWTLMLDGLRAEFPTTEFMASPESAARFREGWQRLKDAVKPATWSTCARPPRKSSLPRLASLPSSARRLISRDPVKRRVSARDREHQRHARRELLRVLDVQEFVRTVGVACGRVHP